LSALGERFQIRPPKPEEKGRANEKPRRGASIS